MDNKMILVVSSLSLAGVLAVSPGCASSGDGGGGGSTGNNSASSAGSGGGGSGGGGSGGGGSSSSSSITTGGDSVTFEKGKAVGLFNGYGWVALGALDTVSDPTCKLDDGTTKAITKAEACSKQTKWKDDGNGKLCISGKIPMLGSPPDYTGNWGVQIGVNAQESSDAVGSALSDFKTVSFTFSGTPATGIRGLFHRKGDDPDKTTPFCMDGIKSGTAYDLVKFNRDCWGPSASTAYLTKEDLANLDIVGIQVPSSTSAEITVSDLCLEKIQFGK